MLDGVRALAFDVFGTVVDWHGSIAREGAERWAPAGYAADWGALAVAWRRRYQPALEQVRSGARAWVPLDLLHRESLDEVLVEFDLKRMPEAERAELNLVWHRLDPWQDSRPGLRVLENRFRLTTLSNGNRVLLQDLARHGRLPFQHTLGAEDFHAYKPQRAVYEGAAQRLGLRPAGWRWWPRTPTTCGPPPCAACAPSTSPGPTSGGWGAGRTHRTRTTSSTWWRRTCSTWRATPDRTARGQPAGPMRNFLGRGSHLLRDLRP